MMGYFEVPSVNMRGGDGELERREFGIFLQIFFFCSFSIFDILPSFSMGETFI